MQHICYTLSATLRSGTALRTAANRLVLAWLPLSLLIAIIAWHYEVVRFEKNVMNDIIHDAAQVSYSDLARYYRQELTFADLYLTQVATYQATKTA